MSRVSAARLRPELSRCQIDLVVHHDDRFGSELEEARRRADRPAALIHVSRRLEEIGFAPRQHALADRAFEASAPRSELIALMNDIRDHEADIVPVAQVGRPGIAQPGDQKGNLAHRKNQISEIAKRKRSAPALRFQDHFFPAPLPFSAGAAGALPAAAGAVAPAAGAAAAPAAGAATAPSSPSAGTAPSAPSTAAAATGVSSTKVVGGAIVATVKLRSRIIVLTPSGRVKASIWMLSPMSRSERSPSIYSGMLSTGQSRATSCRTMFKTPPRFRPGEFSWPRKCTGMSSELFPPGVSRRKSMWTGRSVTGSSCTARGMTRVFCPANSSITRVCRNAPVL